MFTLRPEPVTSTDESEHDETNTMTFFFINQDQYFFIQLASVQKDLQCYNMSWSLRLLQVKL